MSARVIAFCNQKGGVAKTTTVLNTGAALAKAGKRVLLIDTDAQGSLSVSVGLEELTDQDVTTYELLVEGADTADAIRDDLGAGYDVIPADIRLSAADLKLVSIPGRETLLKDAIEPFISEYDYILIDCPPNLSIVTMNCLTAATELIVPLQANYLALSGLTLLLDTVELVQKRVNKSLKLSGVLLTMYKGRTTHAKEIKEQVADFFGDKVFNTVIRDNIALADAPARGMDIYQYDPRSNGASDYENFTQEIIRMEATK